MKLLTNGETLRPETGDDNSLAVGCSLAVLDVLFLFFIRLVSSSYLIGDINELYS
jgi:hypothetical protein